MLGLFLILPLLLPAIPTPPADGPPKWPVPHLGTIEDVRRESRERNTVLAVFVLQEGEEANDRFRNKLFQNAELAKKCEELVVLLVNDGEHAPRKVSEKKDGEVREWEICSAYGTPTCADHRRYFDRVFQDYSGGDALRTPQLLLVLPDGKIHDRLIDEHELAVILRKIAAAQEVAGPGITALELEDVKKAVGTGRSTLATGRWAPAYRAWSRVLELVPAGEFAAEATEGVQDALEGMREELARAMDLFEEGKVVAGYQRLLALKEAHDDTPLEKETAARLRKVEKNKKWKEEIEAYRREVEADALWDLITAALAEDKERTAERHARRILQKYGDTKAADKVRKEFPHLVEETGGG